MLTKKLAKSANKALDVPGAPRGCPLPEDTVEGTWVWGGVPEKLDEGRPFSSRQMRPCLQDGTKNEEGSVLVGGLGDTGDARNRGKVEAFGGHDGWCMLRKTPEYNSCEMWEEERRSAPS